MKIQPFVLAAALALAARAAAAQVMVVSATTEERAAAAGDRYAGTIRVRNTTAARQEARVYASDYRFFADGRSLFEAAGTGARSNAGWVTFSPARLVLAPHEEATVSYTVAVPAGAALRGTYWSVLMVETVPSFTPPAARRSVSVQPVMRYAVQLATHVGEAERKVAFAGTRVAAAPGGGRMLELDVVNTGERADRLELRVELYDESGQRAKELRAPRGLLYPGTSLRQRFELGALPPGTYRALVVADTGADDVFGAEYTLRL